MDGSHGCIIGHRAMAEGTYSHEDEGGKGGRQEAGGGGGEMGDKGDVGVDAVVGKPRLSRC
eukprot:scaffold102258_cov36-Tisochrysis_lutea.AAC.1